MILLTQLHSTLFSGVPQGSVLGPLFFLVYVNDITENFLSLTRLFADDSSLFSATNIQDYEGILNHDLAVISAWAKQWLVTFNPSKTEAVQFSLRQNNPTPSLFFENTLIEFVESHKHLGVTFSSNGNWHTHIENILKSSQGKPSETDSIKFKISSKTPRGKNDSTKRHHQRHHKRQPGEQQFLIQVVTS